MTSKGLGKILALGAGIAVSSLLAEKAYSQDLSYQEFDTKGLKPGDKMPNGQIYQGDRKDIIKEKLDNKELDIDDVSYDEKGRMVIRRKNKAKKETAGVEKKVESEKKAEETKVEEKKVAEEKKETKKGEKRTEIERRDKRVLGLDIKGYLFSDTDANKSRTTGVGIGCDAEAVAFKKLLGIGIGTYTKGKIDYNRASSSYGSDTTSTLDSLTSKFNIPLLAKIKGFYLGFGAQLENLFASIYANRSNNTIAHTENYSGGTANLLIEGRKIGLNAYFGSISGAVEDKINNLSVKRDVNGSSYGLKLVYKINNKNKIITEVDGGKKGDYDSLELKLGYAGKDNMEYGIKTSNVNGNNYSNSQFAVYLSGRLGRKQ